MQFEMSMESSEKIEKGIKRNENSPFMAYIYRMMTWMTYSFLHIEKGALFLDVLVCYMKCQIWDFIKFHSNILRWNKRVGSMIL